VFGHGEGAHNIGSEIDDIQHVAVENDMVGVRGMLAVRVDAGPPQLDELSFSNGGSVIGQRPDGQRARRVVGDHEHPRVWVNGEVAGFRSAAWHFCQSERVVARDIPGMHRPVVTDTGDSVDDWQ
jgi:hypothetical protein